MAPSAYWLVVAVMPSPSSRGDLAVMVLYVDLAVVVATVGEDTLLRVDHMSLCVHSQRISLLFPLSVKLIMLGVTDY